MILNVTQLKDDGVLHMFCTYILYFIYYITDYANYHEANVEEMEQAKEVVYNGGEHADIGFMERTKSKTVKVAKIHVMSSKQLVAVIVNDRTVSSKQCHGIYWLGVMCDTVYSVIVCEPF